MASLGSTTTRSIHATLTTTTADDVTIGRCAFVRVANYSSTDALTVTLNRDATPTAGVIGSFKIGPGDLREFPVPLSRASHVVRVVGNGNTYSVEAVWK